MVWRHGTDCLKKCPIEKKCVFKLWNCKPITKCFILHKLQVTDLANQTDLIQGGNISR